ncbi:putative polyketide synthase [Metarhizium anisopliae]
MAYQPNILLFGDQTETNLSIQALYNHANTSKRLLGYIDAAYEAANQALDQQYVNPDVRAVYHFASWIELEKTIASQEVPDVVLRTTALCFAQLGHFIRLLETDTHLHQAWVSQKLILAASCAGQVPAALAASTQSLDQFVLAAPELVSIAARIGLEINRRANSFNDDRTKSWATAVGTDLESARSVVDGFNRSKDLSQSEGLYVGVTSAWATTIIGSPRLHRDLFDSKPFAEGIKITPLPINAPFHAFNAPKPDLKWIIGTAPVLDLLALTKTVFLSSEDGVAFPPQTGAKLVCEAVLNILSRMTDNSKVFSKVSDLLGQQDGCIVPVVAEKGARRMVLDLKEKKVYLYTRLPN